MRMYPSFVMVNLDELNSSSVSVGKLALGVRRGYTASHDISPSNPNVMPMYPLACFNLSKQPMRPTGGELGVGGCDIRGDCMVGSDVLCGVGFFFRFWDILKLLKMLQIKYLTDRLC